MRQTKYITSGGLAFAEEQDMGKLRRYSLKGWHVRDFKFMGYTLEKGESRDYIYSIDYRPLNEDEKEEYLEFFSSSGWSHVTSEANIHLFRANSGTNPIYSDQDTTVEKYKNLNSSMKNVSISLFLSTIILWTIFSLSTGTLKVILFFVAAILSSFVLPIACTLAATYSNKWKVKGKKGTAILLRVVPFVIFLITVIGFLSVFFPDNVIRIITSMAIGGIAFPTAIWGMMSLYHIVGRKRN
ncbi:DUF2812 domain-containing protein [Oceanobacillus piezotolerans]|uniref:DUF2812 domain-containing protein n=1 Tax=Oceanobacillus piezotolerans TaxID=2448030 RepID=A0A498DGK9_9BACI|nr:DUF2812 domain-containing protein [Oceanobacillus piezotolerans]RLL48328.1 DUF2812 domain-containing protein [Oceanobacillus piezotolerans]